MRLHPPVISGWYGSVLDQEALVFLPHHLAQKPSSRIDLEIIEQFKFCLRLQNRTVIPERPESAVIVRILNLLSGGNTISSQAAPILSMVSMSP